MHEFEGEVNEDPEGDRFLSFIAILANDIDHDIADKSDLLSFQSVNRSPQISLHMLLYLFKPGKKWAFPSDDPVDELHDDGGVYPLLRIVGQVLTPDLPVIIGTPLGEESLLLIRLS